MQANKQAGFSIIELLIVLAAVNFILIIGYHQYSKNSNQHDFELWYQQFELDLIQIQKQTMTTEQPHIIFFRPSQNVYDIAINTFNPALIRRELPNDWQIMMDSLTNPIRFTHAGNIRNPGTMRINTGQSEYTIYFPFGKGRSYYVKTK